MVADGAIPASSTPSVNLALILISNPDLNAQLASRCFFFGATCHGSSVVAVFLPPDAVAAVLLAEQDPLSRRRVRAGGGGRSCGAAWAHNTHLAV